MSRSLRAFGGLDADFVVETFITSLADPHNPKHCALCISGCITSLCHNDVGTHNIPILRAHYRQFYDNCVAFITVTRTTEENERLEEELNVCKCDLDDNRIRKLHEYGELQFNGDCSYKELGHMFASQVHNAIQPARDAGNLHKVDKNRERAARRGKEVPWPTSPEDLLPNGPDASIAAMAAWIEFGRADPIWLGLIASMLDLCKKELIEPILASPTLPGKLVGISEIPLMVWGALRSGIKSQCTPDIVVAHVKRVGVLLKMIIIYFDPEEIKALYYRAIEQFSPTEPDRDFVHICKIHLDMLPELAMAVRPGSEAARDVASSREYFMAAGAHFHHIIGLPFDVQRYGVAIILNSLNRLKLQGDPAFTAYEAICRLWLSERCWAPGCQETFVSARRTFSACSGCKRVSYCSKACLATAWKHEHVPHKAVCKNLRYVCETAGLGPKPPPQDKVAFQLACVSNKIDDVILADITVHMNNLLKYLSFVPPPSPGVTQTATESGSAALLN